MVKRKNTFDALLSTVQEAVSLLREIKAGFAAERNRPSLEDQLRAAADWWHEEPGLSHTRGVSDLIKEGFDLTDDILPVVKAYANKPEHRHSWEYFVAIVRNTEAKRLATGSVCVTRERMAEFENSVYLQRDTPGMAAWDAYYRAFGRPGAPRDTNGGWYFPTESPPSAPEKSA